MRLGIDISQIIHKGTGVARYLQGLTDTILDYDRKNQWTFFFSSLRAKLDTQLENKIKKSAHHLIKCKLPVTALSFLWNDLHFFDLDHLVRKLDFFVTSDWIEPPSKSIKKIAVVHDLTVFRYPDTLAHRILVTQEKRLGWVKKESELIIADSQATKEDLISYLEIKPDKIRVIYPGVKVIEPTKNHLQAVMQKYKLVKPFILAVGKIEPRKNIKRLIDAFKGLNNNDLDLVIVGPKGWEQSNNLTIQQSSNVRLLGYLEDDELFALYSSCLFFAYPSIWEGFGYPVVEAMKLGAPVATSNISSLKEIATGVALLFDPSDTADIQNKLHALINNDQLRKKISEKGRIKSREFTWENYYNRFIEALNSQNYSLYANRS